MQTSRRVFERLRNGKMRLYVLTELFESDVIRLPLHMTAEQTDARPVLATALVTGIDHVGIAGT